MSARLLIAIAIVLTQGCSHTRTLSLKDLAPKAGTGPSAGVVFVVDTATTSLGESSEGSFLFVLPVKDRFESSKPRALLVAGAVQSALERAGLPFETRQGAFAPHEFASVGAGRVALVVNVQKMALENEQMFAVLGMVPRAVEATVALEARVYEPGSKDPISTKSFERKWTTPHDQPGAALRKALDAVAWDLVSDSGVRAAVQRIQKDSFETTLAKAKQAEAADNLPLALAIVSKAHATAPSETVADGLFADVVRLYVSLPEKPALAEDTRRIFVQADLAARERRFEEAIALYGDVSKAAPWFPLAHFNRAILLSERGRYADAIAAMGRYVNLAPDAPDTRAAKDKIYEWEARQKSPR